jgi:WD40 repeat protein
VSTGDQIWAGRIEGEQTTSISLSPSGEFLAAGGLLRDFHLWNLKTGRLVATFPRGPHQLERYSPTAFSSDGGILATGDSRGVVFLWETQTGRRRGELPGEKGEVTSLEFSPDGGLLASVIGGKALLWDWRSGKIVRRIGGSAEDLRFAAFSPDGTAVATFGEDSGIQLRTVATDAVIRSFEGHERRPQGRVSTLAFSSDGKTIVSGGYDGTLRFWDIVQGRETLKLGGLEPFPSSCSLSSKGRLLACALGDFRLHLFDVSRGEWIPEEPGLNGPVTCLDLLKKHQVLASGSMDGVVRIWNLGSGQLVREVVRKDTWPGALAFSESGKWLAVGWMDYSLQLCDAATGEAVLQYEGLFSALESVAFAPDGQVLAAGGGRGQIFLWNTSSPKRILTLPGHEGDVRALVFTRDGTQLISAGDDRVIRVWDLRESKEMFELPGHGSSIHGLALSQDGKVLASASSDNTVRIWDLAARREMRRLKAEGDQHYLSVRFSLGGKYIATSDTGGAIRVWEVATDLQALAIEGHHARVSSLAIPKGGRSLISGAGDGMILEWSLSPWRYTSRGELGDPDTLWEELGVEDASRGYRALWSLVDLGARGVDVVEQKYGRLDQGAAETLIRRLDDEEVAVRERSLEELVAMAPVPLLEGAVRTGGSAEIRTRAREALERINSPLARSTEAIRRGRVIQALRLIGTVQVQPLLERIGTQDASAVLKHLREGD